MEIFRQDRQFGRQKSIITIERYPKLAVQSNLFATSKEAKMASFPTTILGFI